MYVSPGLTRNLPRVLIRVGQQHYVLIWNSPWILDLVIGCSTDVLAGNRNLMR